jgi:alkylhydroperoxidase family enzyme
VRIRPIERDEAAEPMRRIYDALEQRTGRVSNLNEMLAHMPDVLRAFGPFYAAVWAEGALSLKLKTFAYLRVSILNGCVY